MKTAVFLMLSSFLIFDTFSQELPENEMELQRLSDELLGFQDADADYEDIYENLVQVLSSPYDLNKVTAEELQLLHILTDLQIQNFIDYRKEQGKFLDIYELQAIPEFDLPVISKLIPFVKVNDPLNMVNRSLLHRIFSKDHSYMITRYERTLETKKGFRPSESMAQRFIGSADKLYFRFRSAKPGDFSIGFTGEKDAGEKIIFRHAHHQYGFDFSSYHIQLQNKGKLKNIIIGDFQSQFAQGLVLGGAFGLGKGGESVSTTRRSHVGFLPYTSINESAYLRGVAVTWQPFKDMNVSGFYSGTRRDASQSGGEDTLIVTSFQTTGLHRSVSEIENRKKVSEQNYGMVMHYQKNKLDAGFIFNAIHFDIPVRRTLTPYNQFAFAGTKNLNTGIFINYRIENFSFFCEAAQSRHGGKGGIAGLLISAHKNFDLSIVYRKYDRNFYTFYSNAFSENTQAQNERGLYWGWKYRWSRKYSLTGYADLFTFPWLAFRRYAPSKGYEWLLRGNYQPSKKISIFLQVREESKFRNLPGVTHLYQLGEGLKRNLWLNCDYGIGEKVRLKSRIQYSRYFFNEETTEGLTLLQDISFSLGRFKFTGRHALFDTHNYDNRQYVYENDAWLAYSLPAYAGVGVRNYALFEYKVHKQLTVWLRYARTRLSNGDEIGSGQDVIEGNTKNDVKFQVRFNF
jgi:hypothetical protein